MAVLDPFEVAVLVDGKPATEYDDAESLNDSNDPRTITKYVEVKSGSRFAFKLTVLPSYRPGNEDGLSCSYTIDGSRIPGKMFRKEWVNDVYGLTRIIDTQTVTSGGEYKQVMFRFADLETRKLHTPVNNFHT